jgi:hypothetical protein
LICASRWRWRPAPSSDGSIRHVEGLMHLAVDHGDYAYFPKYEFDGRQFVDEPKGTRVPLYVDRVSLRESKAPLSEPRYP